MWSLSLQIKVTSEIVCFNGNIYVKVQRKKRVCNRNHSTSFDSCYIFWRIIKYKKKVTDYLVRVYPYVCIYVSMSYPSSEHLFLTVLIWLKNYDLFYQFFTKMSLRGHKKSSSSLANALNLTQTLSLSVALSLAAALHADFSGWWYCVDILSTFGYKSRWVFTTKCNFRGCIHSDLRL